MDLRLTPPSSALASRIGAATTGARPQGTGGAGEAGFAGAMKTALHSVSAAQNESTRLQREVQMENPAVSLEETMVAIQKAQIGFQATVHVRNRMVQAYTDIMNMQV
jgi:flagellar hook-basal body complex protein FliE